MRFRRWYDIPRIDMNSTMNYLVGFRESNEVILRQLNDAKKRGGGK